MLALQQADEARISIRDYLRATFGFRDPKAMQAFENLLNDQESGVFKGPYINIQLPYRKSDGSRPVPLEVAPEFTPYLHQFRAFERLSTQNQKSPQPGIITTGTASGKTEAFLYPLLDYCYRNRKRKGIKAIILYPMNALATDQAGRLAEAIYHDDRLRGKVNAGLFIGEGRQNSREERSRTMGPERIIEDRETIVASPPDILLTNFKMLDFSLMQAQYHNLWSNNVDDPEVLRFLVIDELHTYDGVKGTDVANLIRRLKLKLAIPDGHLCPVGTSATLGSGEEAERELADFATRVFGEVIRDDAIIQEARQPLKEFLQHSGSIRFIPGTQNLRDYQLLKQQSYGDYIRRQKELWQIDPDEDPVSLGHSLKNYTVVRHLLECLEDEPLHIDDLIIKLSRKNREFAGVPGYDDRQHIYPRKVLVSSLLALIAEARTLQGQKQEPFLYVQTKLWVREFSPVVRLLTQEPQFALRDQVDYRRESPEYLPAYFCRECGGSGWLSLLNRDHSAISGDFTSITGRYFQNHQDVCFITPNEEAYQIADDYNPTTRYTNIAVDPTDFRLYERDAENGVAVALYQKHRSRQESVVKTDPVCPHCSSRNTLNIIGTRNSTMLSVAVSQVLSSDLDERGEHQRKLLGFTDSVQDAAHRAGFIQARNYRFTFRSALQTVINEHQQPVSLTEVIASFTDYWKAYADPRNEDHLKAYFYRFFPEDKEKDFDIDAKYAEGQNAIAQLDDRVSWEIASEFGYNSIIGRTLEKSGSSAAWIPSEKMSGVYDALRGWLDANNLGMIDRSSFLKFLSIFLYRIRTRGGVHNPVMELYRTSKPNYFTLGPRANTAFPMARHFGKRTRLPRLLVTEETGFEIYDRTYRARSNPMNWFHHYFIKSFPLAGTYHALINDFYEQLASALADEQIGIFSARDARGITNYCINPEELLITPSPAPLKCNLCSHQLFVDIRDQEVFAGASCHQFNCTGRYEPHTTMEQESYYREVYNRSLTPRIYTHEHTGILDRDEREELEYNFKNRPKFNDPNVLVATSTLEMGIDIGDLDTSINIDIPANTASYKQRIGRAGRKSGSALILNFSSRDDHDLFYFEDPVEMMEGEITTPSCFLDAYEILKRHFYAFCFDSWTKADPTKHTIPRQLKSIGIANLDTNDSEFFINKYFSFARKQLDELYDRFAEQYKEIREEVIGDLYKYVTSARFEDFVRSAFERQKQQLDQLNEHRQEIQTYIRQKGLDENDPEYKDLMSADRDLKKSRSKIFSTPTLEFMTNEGILPNYGFPETGIRFDASVFRPEKDDSEAIQAVRPASSGLRELAPDQYFYMKKYRLPVTGLDLQNREQEVITYRFCSNCDALQVDAQSESTQCPKCGHSSWGSAGNTHTVLNFKGAHSSAKRNEVLADDHREERELEFPAVTRHFEFSDNGSHGSYVMKKNPFGIEYDTDVTLRELNTGPQKAGGEGVHQKNINEKQVSETGYVCCRKCGKATAEHEKWDGNTGSNQPKKAEDYHYPYCSLKHVCWGSSESDATFDHLYLKRELPTEAIKILLPIQEVDIEARLEVFKAGLQIGLRKFFNGIPDHLKMQDYREVNKTTNKKDQYLILYDSIPGGSGYLSRLFDEQVFSELMRSALNQLQTCECQQKEKAGCYKCVYNYNNRFKRGNISRAFAEEFFTEICESISEWQFQTGGLSGMTDTGGVEESELEMKFIRLLRWLSEKNDKLPAIGTIGLETYKSGEKRIYQLTLGQDNDRRVYEIIPQYELGPRQEVQYATRPDFMIFPQPDYESDEHLSDARKHLYPIAVFLDGYQYHASQEHNTFYKDVLKRQSILNSGKLLVWTLTWNDLDRFEGDSAGLDQLAETLKDNTSNKVHHAFKDHPNIRREKDAHAQHSNNVERLLYLLKQGPELEQWRDTIQKSVFKLQSKAGVYRIQEEGVTPYLDGINTPDELPKAEANATAWMVLDRLPESGNISWKAAVAVKSLECRFTYQVEDSEPSIPIEDWEYFWQLFNTFQFLEMHGERVSETGVPDQKAEPAEDIHEILENFDESLHEVVRFLISQHEEINTDDYFCLTDDKGTIIAEAELGLKQQNIVVNPMDELSAKAFEQAGYAIVSPENLLEELDR